MPPSKKRPAKTKATPTWEVFQPEAAAEPVPREPTNEELRAEGLRHRKPKLPSRKEIAAREAATKAQLFDGALSGLVSLFALIVMVPVAAGGLPFSDSGWHVYGTADLLLVMLLASGRRSSRSPSCGGSWRPRCVSGSRVWGRSAGGSCPGASVWRLASWRPGS